MTTSTDARPADDGRPTLTTDRQHELTGQRRVVASVEQDRARAARWAPRSPASGWGASAVADTLAGTLKPDYEQRVSKATGVLTRLGSVMVEDLDTAAGGFGWWHGYTNARRIGLIIEYCV